MKKLFYLLIFFGLTIAQPAVATDAAAELLPFEPEMVLLDGGTFQMGCVSGKYCRPDELPVHDVAIKPFEIGKYEVTIDQWNECVKQKVCKHNQHIDSEKGNQPAVSMSWNDAQEYVTWLSEKTGKTYRLPTEAEWEYAARANTKTPFPTGECINTDQANYQGRRRWYKSNCPKTDKFQNQTVKVGSFPANQLGLYDMQGNVTEWVQDCYHSSYDGAPKDGSAWESDCSTTRVYRGGQWSNPIEKLRSARRNGYVPTRSSSKIGFRIARTI